MHPVLFHLGSFPVRAYGVMVAVGIVIALRYVLVQVARRQTRGHSSPGGDQSQTVLTADHVLDMVLVGVAVGIAGTRIAFVALHWEMFRENPWDVFRFWTGGLSFIGGPLFGFGYAWWYCRRHGLSFAEVADLASPGFALAYVFGRIGCFLNGCCYGHACELPWAVRFHADGVGDGLTPPSHPTQIYAAIMNAGVFLVLHRMLQRPHRRGQIVLAYAGLYATYRFVNDFFRAGATSRLVLGGLTDGQVAALVAIPVLALLWLRLRTQAARGDASPTT